MKNIQIVDGAWNTTLSIFAATDDEFDVIFCEEGQNVEFIEDLAARIGDEAIAKLFGPVWKRPVVKSAVEGIHGTLFYGLERRREMYPNKKESDLCIPVEEAKRLYLVKIGRLPKDSPKRTSGYHVDARTREAYAGSDDLAKEQP